MKLVAESVRGLTTTREGREGAEHVMLEEPASHLLQWSLQWDAKVLA